MLKVSNLYQTTDRVGFHQKLSSLMQLDWFIFAIDKCNLTLGEKVEIHPLLHTTTWNHHRFSSLNPHNFLGENEHTHTHILLGEFLSMDWFFSEIFTGNHGFWPKKHEDFPRKSIDLHFSGWNLWFFILHGQPRAVDLKVRWKCGQQWTWRADGRNIEVSSRENPEKRLVVDLPLWWIYC